LFDKAIGRMWREQGLKPKLFIWRVFGTTKVVPCYKAPARVACYKTLARVPCYKAPAIVACYKALARAGFVSF